MQVTLSLASRPFLIPQTSFKEHGMNLGSSPRELSTNNKRWPGKNVGDPLFDLHTIYIAYGIIRPIPRAAPTTANVLKKKNYHI